MNDLNYVLDVLVHATQELNKLNELTESQEQLRRDLGEAFNVTSNEIKHKTDFSNAVRKACKDGEIMALGESDNYTKVSIDNLNAVIRLLNK